MSSPPSTTTQTSNTDPWGPAQPYMKDILSQASGVYSQGSQYSPFSTVVPFSPTTQLAQNLTTSRALAGSPVTQAAQGAVTNIANGGGVNPATKYLTDTANGMYADPNSNPYLQATFNQGAQGIRDQVNATFGAAGRTGSGYNQDVLEKNLGNFANDLYGQNYANERGMMFNAANSLGQNYNTGQTQQLAAAQLAPGLASQDYTDLQALGGVGAAQEDKAGQSLQDLLSRWDYSQNAPWQLLQQYGGMLGLSGANSPGFNTQVQKTTTPGQSMLPQLLGAGLGLALAPMTGGASLFGSLLGGAGAAGAGAGAAGGAMMI